MDAVSPDLHPANSVTTPPPDLRWDSPQVNAPEHWRFLISRHGRAINVCMADGSARAVPLEETYMLTWKQDWKPTKLFNLPLR
jgi:prepilin-type processing-associated H-X9-DG protein